MSRPSHNVHSCMELLNKRAIHIDDATIKAVLDDSARSSALDAWIQAYAQPATLLSREELLFLQKVNPSKKEAVSGISITDQAFEDTVSSLNASISSIDEQCRVLESHKNALTVLRDQNASADKIEASKQSNQKTTRQRAQLEFDNDTATSETRAQLGSHNQRVAAILDAAPNTAMKALEKDDRILDSLQKIVPRLDAHNDDKLSTDYVDLLCQQWVFLERQAVRQRFDEVYDTALKTSTPTSVLPAHLNVSAEGRAVRAELVELSSEIDGLVALVAEHHYRTLIKRSLAHARSDAEAESAKWSEYMACVLLYLTARLDALHELYEHSHAHKAALSSLEVELTNLLIAKSIPQTGLKREITHTGRGLKPLRLVQAASNDAQETTSQAFKLLNMRPMEEENGSTISQKLTTTHQERSSAIGTYLEVSGRQHSREMAQSIERQSQHFKSLLNAVQPQADRASMARLKSLEAQTDELAKRMQSLDVDAILKSLSL